ncbi:D-glycero-beta-D-manno-heptose-7-phosphate kinase [Candidatus Magnetobacterium casense]|uniref:D-glycero-beta-D-manno-heptose-7-phosphate kinase n=1 Tax=Candidatus Magnetobacterium casense TaxID=1455061 RepID=UPI000A4A9AA8|nr:D-glycero-beta-D-manno-heptose-7-phosphate kinase [Candidatus Magnetobacterium casensis]
MELSDVLGAFAGKRVLIVGDIILDHFVWGRVNRISPEAPVPVVEVQRESYLLGGAGNVANNIIALGGSAAIVGVIGGDHQGRIISGLLRDKGIEDAGVFCDARPTTIKTRVIAHHQQVVRFDREDARHIDGNMLKGIGDFIGRVIGDYDGVIVSDYKKGVISPRLIQTILGHTSPTGKFVCVDPKVGHFHYYRGVSLITPNLKEAQEGSGIAIKDNMTLQRAGATLLKNLHTHAILITRGEEGMSLFLADGTTHHLPTVAKKVFDVTGAGDTVIAAFTLAFVSGASMVQAAILSNHAAGIVVGMVGTATTSVEEIKRSMVTA